MLKKSYQVEKIIELEWLYIEKRSIWMWQFWLFLLWVNKNISSDISKKIQKLAIDEKVVFVQIESCNYSWHNDWKVKYFSKWYYKKFITPFTAIIDLQLTEEEILAHMKPKWRYNIRLSEKKWVEVHSVEKSDKNIRAFYDIMMETTSRDNFAWNSLKYYETFLGSLDNSQLFLAYKDDVVIAGGIFVFDKTQAIYYYWASTGNKKYRNLMAPYLLQWEAIKTAKELGCKIYDFLWIAGKNDKNSSLSWVTDFKLKLTKNTIHVSDSFIWINKRFHYTVLVLWKKLKKLL